MSKGFYSPARAPVSCTGDEDAVLEVSRCAGAATAEQLRRWSCRRYWMLVVLIDAFGTTPRSISSWPLCPLPVFNHFSYSRSKSEFEEQAERSLTSERTSTKPTNLFASS